MGSAQERVHVETIVRLQAKQPYCTWPGGPGCEFLGTDGECCGRFGWRNIAEERTEAVVGASQTESERANKGGRT